MSDFHSPLILQLSFFGIGNFITGITNGHETGITANNGIACNLLFCFEGEVLRGNAACMRVVFILSYITLCRHACNASGIAKTKLLSCLLYFGVYC